MTDQTEAAEVDEFGDPEVSPWSGLAHQIRDAMLVEPRVSSKDVSGLDWIAVWADVARFVVRSDWLAADRAAAEARGAERVLLEAADHFDQYDVVTIGEVDIGNNMIPVSPAERLRILAAEQQQGRES